MQKGVINFNKLTGKHLCQSAGLRSATLLQNFRVNVVKFLRTPFLENTSGRLLLIISGETEVN